MYCIHTPCSLLQKRGESERSHRRGCDRPETNTNTAHRLAPVPAGRGRSWRQDTRQTTMRGSITAKNNRPPSECRHRKNAGEGKVHEVHPTQRRGHRVPETDAARKSTTFKTGTGSMTSRKVRSRRDQEDRSSKREGGGVHQRGKRTRGKGAPRKSRGRRAPGALGLFFSAPAGGGGPSALSNVAVVVVHDWVI